MRDSNERWQTPFGRRVNISKRSARKFSLCCGRVRAHRQVPASSTSQEENYKAAVAKGKQPNPTLIFIEEAHEFLSAQRIAKMQVLFQQVARIARRGRKRWLGLVFITQLPQHLPDEVMGLINNWILHKVGDAGVVARLKRSIAGVNEGLWQRLPSLAAGQAIVSFTTFARPVQATIDPTPCKLRTVQ